jgi:hypothetical protein
MPQPSSSQGFDIPDKALDKTLHLLLLYVFITTSISAVQLFLQIFHFPPQLLIALCFSDVLKYNLFDLPGPACVLQGV